jgi:phospholipase D3/4
MIRAIAFSAAILCLLPQASTLPEVTNLKDSGSCTIIETIPLTNFTLELVEGGELTHTDLISLTDSAVNTLDITVMYWNLLSTSGSDDDGIDPPGDDTLGSGRGRDLYMALCRAARRGVSLRFLQDNSSKEGVPSELQIIVNLYPDNVSVGMWNAKQWYGGGGIMHQKIWIADSGARVYVGSANMDWLSLSQVKELGIDCVGSTELGAAALSLFESWWGFASIAPDDFSVATVWSDTFIADLEMPCWSQGVPTSSRCQDPLPQPSQEFPTWDNPSFLLGSDVDPGTFFLSASPMALLGNGSAGIRTWDLDALTRTIRSAKKYVHLSVMDFIPTSMYGGGHGDYAVWWSALNDAFLAVSSARQDLEVHLLISEWAHTDVRIMPYLRSLRDAAGACTTPGGWNGDLCGGTLEIRIFKVPGWDATPSGPLPQVYPAYSRVNHAKYIVTEERANIGTSNMAWDYFYGTAGTSLNTDCVGVQETLEAVFQRDWDSSYAVPLD